MAVELTLYAELCGRVRRFEETGDAGTLLDPTSVRLLQLTDQALRDHPPPEADMARTVAVAAWQLHLAAGATPGGARALRDRALGLCAWLDALVPALVPPDIRAGVRRLPRLPRSLARIVRDTDLRLEALFDHAKSAVERYRALHDPATLRTARVLLRELVDATPGLFAILPEDQRSRSVRARTALGVALQLELARTGDLRTLQTARGVCEEAALLCATDDPQRPLVLFNHGSLLFDAFRRTGDEAALEESLEVSVTALNLTPSHDPVRAVRLCHVQNLYSALYDRSADPAVLRSAVDFGAEAARTVPDAEPQRAAILNNYGKDLRELYLETRDLDLLRRAADALRASVAGSFPSDPNRLSRRLLLTRCLLDLAAAERAGGGAALVAEILAVAEETVRLVSYGHTWYRDAVQLLRQAEQLAREAQGGTPADPVEEARRQVRDAPPGRHSRRARRMLGGLLMQRYDDTGDPAALTEGITLLREVDGGPDGPDHDLTHGERLSALTELSQGLFLLYRRRRDLDALRDAETYARRVVAGSPPSGVQRAVALAHLGEMLLIGAGRLIDENAHAKRMSEAVSRSLEAYETCPDDHPLKPSITMQAGQAVLALCDGENSEPALLTLALILLREAVAAIPLDATNGPMARIALAGCLQTHHRAAAVLETPEPDALGQAAALAREAAGAVPEQHPDRLEFLLALAVVREGDRREARAAGDAERAAEAAAESEEAYRQAVAVTAARPDARLVAAARAGSLAMDRGDADTALADFETAVGLLPLIAPHELARRDRQFTLVVNSTGLAPAVAAAAVAAGRPARAVELLERARGVLAADALSAPDDALFALYQEAPELADGFVELRAAAPTAFEGTAEERLRHGLRWTDLLARIRALPGHADFLAGPRIDELRSAAGEGPVVLVHTGPWRSDALILDPAAPPEAPVDVVPLPDLTGEDTLARTRRFLQVLQDLEAPGDDPFAVFAAQDRAQTELHDTLTWLWDAVAAPVLDRLGIDGAADGPAPRVWWCPVGLLALLPLHAAGRHREPPPAGRRRATLLDRTVSSMTSTLSALAQARTRPAAPPDAGTLVVALPQTPDAEPLGHAEEEATRVAELLRPAGPVTLLSGPAATARAVLDALPRHGTAHFVCHGLTEPFDPSASRLLLADHREDPLTVARLAGLRLRDAELAYLSACSTGVTNHRLADESVHITAAFQLCGYRQVVGTLWPVTDAAAAAVAASFHARRADGLSGAAALTETLRELRDRYPATPTRWAAHVHTGA
ncbi:CHAT domain-containing protein [Streptomyces sp. HUAS MG47]|uniref:CHAT domain-containing protein n=1 Tax=Streptomyces solicamelliae TaxID=3231716 RepID=UPI0038779E46